MDVEDQDLRVLLGRMIQGPAVLDHPAVRQINPIPDTELARELDMEMSVQPGVEVESDPNIMTDQNHLLRPLACKAALLDSQEVVC